VVGRWAFTDFRKIFKLLHGSELVDIEGARLAGSFDRLIAANGSGRQNLLISRVLMIYRRDSRGAEAHCTES
jgi:hypothetical protein